MILPRLEPRVKEKLVTHHFGRYNKPVDSSGVLADLIGKQTRPIQAGRCYLFDGTDDYIDLTTHTAAFERNDFILRFTIKRASTATTFQNLFSCGYNATDSGWILRFDGANNLQLSFNNSSLKDQAVNFTFALSSTTTVYDVVLVFTAQTTTPKLYVNGTLYNGSGTMTFEYTGTAKKTLIGARTVSGAVSANYYNGRIWNILYCPYSLSNLNAILANHYTFVSDAVAFYKCEETAGTTSYDSSGNGRHGTIMNASVSAFHSTDTGVLFSWANEYGYSKAPIYTNDFSNTFGNVSTVTYSGNGTNELSGGVWKITRTAGSGSIGGRYETGSLEVRTLRIKLQVRTTNNNSGQLTLRLHNSFFTITTSWLFIDTIVQKNTNQNYLELRSDYNASHSAIGDIIEIDNLSVEELEIIPRNEANTLQDVLGNALTYSGRVKYNALLKQSNCVSLDGTDDRIDLGSYANLELNNFIIGFWIFETSVSGTNRDSLIEIQASVENTTGRQQRNGFTIANADNGALNVITARADGALYSGASTVANLRAGGAWEFVAIAKNGAAWSFYVYKNGAWVNHIQTYTGTETIYYDKAYIKGTRIGATYFQNTPQYTAFFGGRLCGIQYAPYSSDNLTKILSFQTMAGNLLHLPMAEGAGSRVFDVSGNGYHGTITNATLTTVWGTKQDVYHYNFNKGYKKLDYFNNTNSYKDTFLKGVFTAPQTATIGFSISFWCYIDSTGTSKALIGGYTTAGNTTGINIIINPSGSDFNLSFTVQTLTSQFITSLNSIGGEIVLQTLTHITVTWDLTTLRIYKNGVLAKSATGGAVSRSAHTNTLKIGNWADPSTTLYNFNGYMYDVRFFSESVKTAADALQLYNNTHLDTGVNYTPNIVNIVNAYLPEFVLPQIGTFVKPLLNAHNGAETQIDFTGGVSSPAANDLVLPSAWKFGDPLGKVLLNNTFTSGTETWGINQGVGSLYSSDSDNIGRVGVFKGVGNGAVGMYARNTGTLSLANWIYSGRYYRIRFDYYIHPSNTVLNVLYIQTAYWQTQQILNVVGQWTSIDVTMMATANINFFNISAANVAIPATDKMYLDNVILEEWAGFASNAANVSKKHIRTKVLSLSEINKIKTFY